MNEFSDTGSIPVASTKRYSDEHLLLQRRFRREVFALIQTEKHRLRKNPETALFCCLHIRTFDFRCSLRYNGNAEIRRRNSE